MGTCSTPVLTSVHPVFNLYTYLLPTKFFIQRNSYQKTADTSVDLNSNSRGKHSCFAEYFDMSWHSTRCWTFNPWPQLHCQTVGHPRQCPALGSNVPAALVPTVNRQQPPLPTGSGFFYAHSPPALHVTRNHPPIPGPVSQLF